MKYRTLYVVWAGRVGRGLIVTLLTHQAIGLAFRDNPVVSLLPIFLWLMIEMVMADIRRMKNLHEEDDTHPKKHSSSGEIRLKTITGGNDLSDIRWVVGAIIERLDELEEPRGAQEQQELDK